jgi:hypothetical protein
VHLSFGERSAEPEIREEAPEGSDPLKEGISATLESIRRQIEEGSGKVQPPPPPPAPSRRPGRTRRWSTRTPRRRREAAGSRGDDARLCGGAEGFYRKCSDLGVRRAVMGDRRSRAQSRPRRWPGSSTLS